MRKMYRFNKLNWRQIFEVNEDRRILHVKVKIHLNKERKQLLLNDKDYKLFTSEYHFGF